MDGRILQQLTLKKYVANILNSTPPLLSLIYLFEEVDLSKGVALLVPGGHGQDGMILVPAHEMVAAACLGEIQAVIKVDRHL